MTADEIEAEKVPFRVRNKATGEVLTAVSRDMQDPILLRGTNLVDGFVFRDQRRFIPTVDLVRHYDLIG